MISLLWIPYKDGAMKNFEEIEYVTQVKDIQNPKRHPYCINGPKDTSFLLILVDFAYCQ